jgi:hypothetical protein
MKDILFWTLLLVIFISILFVSQVDGFINVPEAGPPRESITTGDFKAYAPPSFTLLSPPPGGVASVNSLPYIDPSQQKAPYTRIKEVLETANGFLNVEAPKLIDASDPAIQLPLRTLTSDVRRLKNEILVLDRNPGLESTLTQHDVDSIEANLTYLQKKWRTVHEVEVEGFQSGSATQGAYDASGNSYGPTDASDASGNATAGVNERASLLQLKELVTRVAVEITRLSASATTDPVVTQRVATLTAIQKAVQGIIDKVSGGQMAETEIPILESDYLSFLPVLSTQGPLPRLLKNNHLPLTLASLLPSYNVGDISGASMAQYLVQTYGDTFFKGLSWDLELNYTAERNAGTATAAALSSVLASQGIQTNVSQAVDIAKAKAAVPTAAAAPAVDVPYRGEFAAKTSGPAHLDWKQRSTDICNAIQKRGYNPGDFGCLVDISSVSPNFSWRGYAKMVCTRVATIYDTGAPEAVGCPPLTWAGWRA